MTIDRDQQDRQAFEEWWVQNSKKHPGMYYACLAGFQAALRIAEEQRKQEEPVAWLGWWEGKPELGNLFEYEDDAKSFAERSFPEWRYVPLIVRDKEQP